MIFLVRVKKDSRLVTVGVMQTLDEVHNLIHKIEVLLGIKFDTEHIFHKRNAFFISSINSTHKVVIEYAPDKYTGFASTKNLIRKLDM